MSDFISKIGVGNPTDPDYEERYIKLDSDHVDVLATDGGDTVSLTDKIHDLEQGINVPIATDDEAGIVKPGKGLIMDSEKTDGTIDLAYDHKLTIRKEKTEGGYEILGEYSGVEDQVVTLPQSSVASHASTTPVYGVGTEQSYGHVKLKGDYTENPTGEAIALSMSGANNMYNTLKKASNIEYNSSGSQVLTDVNTVQAALQKADTVLSQSSSDMKNVINAVYPVGAILMSMDSTNPKNYQNGFFANTEWREWGRGTVIAGRSSSGIFSAASGGSQTAKFTVKGTLPATNTESHKLTTAEIPSHDHGEDKMKYPEGIHTIGSDGYPTDSVHLNFAIRAKHLASDTGTVRSSNVLQAGSNIQEDTSPAHVSGAESVAGITYVKTDTYYCNSYKFDGTHKHQLVGGNGGHTHSIAQKNLTMNETTIDIIPPFTTCYMWQRVS